MLPPYRNDEHFVKKKVYQCVVNRDHDFGISYNFTYIHIIFLLSWWKCIRRCFSELINLCSTNSISNNTCILSVSWESAAAFSTNTGTIQGQPACPLEIFDLEQCANTLSCQCHGCLAERPLFPRPSPLAKADKWFLFVLCSKGRSYRYNPQMMSGICQWSLWMTKTSPTPLQKKTPSLLPRKIESPNTLLIFFFSIPSSK